MEHLQIKIEKLKKKFQMRFSSRALANMCNGVLVRVLDEDNSKRFLGTHTCEPSTLEGKVGGSGVQSQFWLFSEISASVGL